MDTEILTSDGFKRFEQLTNNSEIACYNKGVDKIEFYRPISIWKSEMKEHLISSIENEHIHWRLTNNHRCLIETKKGKLKVVTADSLPSDNKILHGAKYDGSGIDIDLDWLRFFVATQGDGEIRKDCDVIIFSFTKRRKLIRIQEIINKLGIKCKVKDTGDMRSYVSVYGIRDKILAFMGWDKSFPNILLRMNDIQRSTFLEEIWHWDGLFTRKNNYSSCNEHNVDIIQSIMTLHGWRAHKRAYWSKLSKKPNFQLDVSKKRYSYTSNAKKVTQPEVCEVWCVKVPTDFFIARRGSDTFITGNCQNIPRDDKRIKSTLVARPGKAFVSGDFSQVEPRVFASVSQDKRLMECFSKGEDFYSVVGIPIFKDFTYSTFKNDPRSWANTFPHKRQVAKQVALASAYGTSAFQQSEKLRDEEGNNLSSQECQGIIDAYFEAYPRVKKMMEDSHEMAKKDGVVYSLYGRPRRIPEARNLVLKYGPDVKHKDLGYSERTLFNLAMNHRVQSTAASIMNRAMIACYNRIVKEGLDAKIVLSVHDEVIIECAEDKAEYIAALLKDCMEHTVELPGVALETDPKIAKDLAGLK